MLIKDFLHRFNVTQEAFADALHISVSSVYKYVQLKRQPPLDVAYRIIKLSKGQVKLEDMIITTERRAIAQKRVETIKTRITPPEDDDCF